MTVVTFARDHATGTHGYYCADDGDHSGRYVRAEAAEALLAACKHAREILALQPAPTLGGWNWPQIVSGLDDAIRLAEAAP
jgi:hypothetical protein